MTKDEAIYNFWAEFTIPTYEENSVTSSSNESISMPYITYEKVEDVFNSSIVATVSLWTRGTSWKEADEYTHRISERIIQGGVIIPCDEGAIWIKKDSPFCVSTGDPSDNLIKRKLFNIKYEFLA